MPQERMNSLSALLLKNAGAAAKKCLHSVEIGYNPPWLEKRFNQTSQQGVRGPPGLQPKQRYLSYQQRGKPVMVILNRVRTYLEAQLLDAQQGLRQQCGTPDALFSLSTAHDGACPAV